MLVILLFCAMALSLSTALRTIKYRPYAPTPWEHRVPGNWEQIPYPLTSQELATCIPLPLPALCGAPVRFLQQWVTTPDYPLMTYLIKTKSYYLYSLWYRMDNGSWKNVDNGVCIIPFTYQQADTPMPCTEEVGMYARAVPISLRDFRNAWITRSYTNQPAEHLCMETDNPPDIEKTITNVCLNQHLPADPNNPPITYLPCRGPHTKVLSHLHQLRDTADGSPEERLWWLGYCHDMNQEYPQAESAQVFWENSPTEYSFPEPAKVPSNGQIFQRFFERCKRIEQRVVQTLGQQRMPER